MDESASPEARLGAVETKTPGRAPLSIQTALMNSVHRSLLRVSEDRQVTWNSAHPPPLEKQALTSLRVLLAHIDKSRRSSFPNEA